LVAAWAERGAALPVAIVVSVFDDLLEDAPSFAHALSQVPSGKPLALDDIAIDRAGIARLKLPAADAVAELSRLLRDALAGGGGDEVIPAAAQPLLRQALSGDPWVRPSDPDVMRSWIRKALGPPAARQEVSAAVEAASSPPLAVPSMVPSNAPSRAPSAGPHRSAGGAVLEDLELPILSAIELRRTSAVTAAEPLAAEPATGSQAAPDSPAPPAAPTKSPAPEIAGSLTARDRSSTASDQLETEVISSRDPLFRAVLPEFPSPPPRASAPSSVPSPAPPPPLLPRPVMRHAPQRSRPVSLPAAPPARLHSGAAAPGSYIQVPVDARRRWLRFALLLIAAALLVLLVRR
jgi:hypothetical protein